MKETAEQIRAGFRHDATRRLPPGWRQLLRWVYVKSGLGTRQDFEAYWHQITGMAPHEMDAELRRLQRELKESTR